jgi:hypothetical protein
MNALPTLGAALGMGGAVSVVGGVTYYFTPKFWEVGYMPTQPGWGFNHQLHAGTLGIDCRYCHTHVEDGYHSNVPNVSTCMGCHSEGKLNPAAVTAGDKIDEKVAFIREAYAEDRAIPWVKIHMLPDYVKFPHHVHVKAGISCYSCHGQIAGMPVVYQAESLSMGWCLSCHREPQASLVPPEKVTDLVWVEEEWMAKAPKDRAHAGLKPEDLVQSLFRSPPEHCAACHY